MIDINELRQSLGAIQTEVAELLDRLEAAESDALEQARLSGMGSEREAALMARLEAAEKEREELHILIAAIKKQARSEYVLRVKKEEECTQFRARIEAMERQEPVARMDESVRKAWVRFSNAIVSGDDAPYPGMSEAFEQHFSQSFTDREWRAESATWAAAWKAAKRHEAQARPAPSIPERWKLVPIEPTPGMIDAAEYVDWGDADVRGSCINAWDRMLAAAPEAKP